jgi:hypothetical protein
VLLIAAFVTALAACGSGNGEDGYINQTNPDTPNPSISVKLDNTKLVIANGASKTLTAAVSPAGQTLKWTSNNEAAATVDQNGEVTGVAAGSASVTVTMTSDAKSASCTVTVVDYVFTVTNETEWDDALSQITNLDDGSANSSKVFAIDITDNFSVKGRDTPNITGEYKEVWLTGGKTISLSSNGNNGSLIKTAEKQTFIIDGPVLQGKEDNNAPLVKISEKSSAVELRSGGIKDNGNTGVLVDPYGTFTMNGGIISGNTSDDGGAGGGGVLVHSDGTFIMNDGTITGNHAKKKNGGGVWVNGGGGIFTMNGGTISKNHANEQGGGVYIQGKFIMNNGTIIDNTAPTWNGVSYGNGVFEQHGGYLQPD